MRGRVRACVHLTHDTCVHGLDTGLRVQMDLSVAQCSGNGIVYDSARNAGCHCFDCFSGPTCAEETPLDNCTINANGGDPYLYEGALPASLCLNE